MIFGLLILKYPEEIYVAQGLIGFGVVPSLGSGKISKVEHNDIGARFFSGKGGFIFAAKHQLIIPRFYRGGYFVAVVCPAF